MMVKEAAGGHVERKTCKLVCTTTTSGIWLANPYCAHDSGRSGLSVRASSSRTTERFNFGLHHSEKESMLSLVITLAAWCPGPEGAGCRNPMTSKIITLEVVLAG